MKVITSIYLYCRPDLRDEWLIGADIDGDVEDSLVCHIFLNLDDRNFEADTGGKAQ